ncbi:MAG: GH39 family glycosyl hydrolase [Alistipes indistinctus]
MRNCVETDADAQTMAYWVLSDIFDEGSIPDAPFSCTYGLMTIHGIRKASYNAFALMRRMEGDLMQVVSPEAIQPGKGITATEEGDIVRVLAWNQNFVELNEAVPFNAAITLPTLKDTAYIITRATIKEGAGSPWETWVVMGRPLNLTSVQQKLLEAASVPEYSLVQDYTAGPGLVAELLPRTGRSGFLRDYAARIGLRPQPYRRRGIPHLGQGHGRPVEVTAQPSNGNDKQNGTGNGGLEESKHIFRPRAGVPAGITVPDPTSGPVPAPTLFRIARSPRCGA